MSTGLLKRIISEIGSWRSSALALQSEKQTVSVSKMRNVYKAHSASCSLVWMTYQKATASF